MSTAHIKVSVDAIIHATEHEDRVIDSLQILGVNKKMIKRTMTEGHFGNAIVMLSATMTRHDADDAIRSLGTALGWSLRTKALPEIESCISDGALYVRLDKQELVGGKIVRSESGTIRVRVSKPVYGKQSPSDMYADLFAE